MFKVILKSILYSVTVAVLASCVHLNSVSITRIPPDRSKAVQAEASRTIVLGFNFDNDYVDEVMEKLKARCPDGSISGILTKDETTSYVFVQTKRVSARGFCVNK